MSVSQDNNFSETDFEETVQEFTRLLSSALRRILEEEETNDKTEGDSHEQ